MTASDIGGVFCAAATPLDATGAPDIKNFAAHCKTLIDSGCDGVALLGTTGEANSFGLAERMAILDGAIDAGIDPAHMLPGTAQTAVTDTIVLTRHAVDAGVRAVLVLPPFYYKGVSDEGIYRAFSSVIEGVGNDRLRVVLYHIPQVSGVAIPHDVIARLREAFPGIVAGIKDSSGDMENMKTMAARFDNFSVLAGADPLLLPLMQAGGAGCITATSNLLAADLRIVFDGWNDPARAAEVAAAQDRINDMRNLSNRYTQLPTIKTMLASRYGDDGWLRVRPPLVELSDAERADVWNTMAALGG